MCCDGYDREWTAGLSARKSCYLTRILSGGTHIVYATDYRDPRSRLMSRSFNNELEEGEDRIPVTNHLSIDEPKLIPARDSYIINMYGQAPGPAVNCELNDEDAVECIPLCNVAGIAACIK